MKEYTDDLLFAHIFGMCLKKSYTIEEITRRVYKNNTAKNIVRIYQCCVVLMGHGVLVPKFVNRELRFQVDGEETEEIIEAPISALMGKDEHHQEILNGITVTSYAYNYQGRIIWGATARILSKFLDVYAKAAGGK